MSEKLKTIDLFFQAKSRREGWETAFSKGLEKRTKQKGGQNNG